MLFQNISYILVSINDILVITKAFIEQHLQAVEKVLKKLKEARIQLKIDKSYFETSSVYHFGYIISREGIKPQSNKVIRSRKLNDFQQ